MAEDVIIDNPHAGTLRWPSTCVRCGAPTPSRGLGIAAVPACERHAFAEGLARHMLTPTPGRLALRLPAYLGAGWLVQFLLATAHRHVDLASALATVSPVMRGLFVYGALGTIALLLADWTAGLRSMYPDVHKRTLLLRFRRPESAQEFRALNDKALVAGAKPTAWWLRDSPALAIVLVILFIATLDVIRHVHQP